MADLGKEVLVLEADPSPFEAGLAKAGGALKQFGDKADKDAKAQAKALTDAQKGVGKVGLDSLTGALGGGQLTADKALGTFQQASGLLPGAMAGIATVVIGAFSAITAKLEEKAKQIRDAAQEGFGAVVSGARNARQAVSDVGLSAAARGLDSFAERELMQRQRQMNLAQLRQEGGLAGRAFDFNPFVQAAQGVAQNETPEQAVSRIAGRVAQAQALFRQLEGNPQIRQLTRQMAGERIMTGLGDRETAAADLGAQGQLQARMLASGSSAQEAADAAQRLGVAQQYAAQTGITLVEAQARLALGLANLSLAQRQAREGAASAQLGQAIRAGREEVELAGRRTEFLRQARGIMVDMSAEEQQIALLRRQGAAPDVVLRAQEQLDATRQARLREEEARQGRALREQTRSPLESFALERQRLEQLLGSGAIDETTFSRGLDQAIQQVERSVGEAPIGQAAMQEGSAAAASAILRAQRQAQREDRGARLAQIQAEALEQQRQQRQIQREQLDLLRQGRIFQAANL